MESSGKIVIGKRTHADLHNIKDCYLPWQEDAWGHMRPAFSPQLARLCAELSADCYDLEIEHWLEAGWTDGTFQAEQQVYGGFTGWQAGRFDPSKVLRSQMALRRARSHMSAHPVGDIVRTVQQMFATSTGKVLVLAIPVPPDRFMIAICFMGTSRKFYDWFTNLKVAITPEGLHEGFSDVSRQFEGNAAEIHFPEIASALNMPDLTLANIIQEAGSLHSRFHLLITGHSQGGAVAQCYIHRLIHQHGVRPAHITGYTFAAPTVASAQWPGGPSAYPVYNIINIEDCITRMGAHMRLGMDMVFFPGEDFRRETYMTDLDDPERVYATGRLRRMLQHIKDTPTGFEAIIALFLVMQESHGEVGLEILTRMNAVFRFLPSAMSTIGLSLNDFNKLITTRMTSLYRDAFNTLPDQEVVQGLSAELLEIIHEIGAGHFCEVLIALLFSPHTINIDPKSKSRRSPSYIAIVRDHINQLTPGIWHPSPTPCVRDGKGEQLLPTTRTVPMAIRPGDKTLLGSSAKAVSNMEQSL